MELTPEQRELLELALHVPEDHIPQAKEALRELADPFWLALKSAPYDDEPVTDDDVAALREAQATYERGELIAHDDILREFGLK